MVSSCRLSSRLGIEMALSQASLGGCSLPALISIKGRGVVKTKNTSVRAQCAKMKSTRIMAEKATAIISASAAMARPRLRRGFPPTASIETSFDKGFPRSRRKAWKAVCITL